jgi:hypothetical protein
MPKAKSHASRHSEATSASDGELLVGGRSATKNVTELKCSRNRGEGRGREHFGRELQDECPPPPLVFWNGFFTGKSSE